MDEQKINPKHSGVRTFLRLAGPGLMICGVLMFVHGLPGFMGTDEGAKDDVLTVPFGGGEGDFEARRRAAHERFEAHRRATGERFQRSKDRSIHGWGWCVGGMFAFAIGLAMTAAGFMGAVARYQAAEVAPVGKDTFNYLADGTRDGVKTVAGAIGAGLAAGLGGAGAGQAERVVRCHKCNADNDANAKFCGRCGAALAKTRPCPGCGELNDPDARFCDACGKAME